jgi:enoyl-CoA hydratase/carnithine racemase
MTDVICELQGHLAFVTLNRPDQLNTISHSMLLELSDALLECDANTEVRAIVLTGRGRAFCAGLDLHDASSDEGISRGGFPQAMKLDQRTFPTIVLRDLDTPVICAINGGTAGFGIDLALSCDIRLCAAHAKLAVSHTRRGVFPDMGGTWLLPRTLGWSKAAQLVFTGRTIGAAEGERLGLIDRVVEGANLMAGATELAEEIANCAPLAVQAAKRLMRAGCEESFADHVQRSYLQVRLLTETRDFSEGVSAFLEKRLPNFRGD